MADAGPFWIESAVRVSGAAIRRAVRSGGAVGAFLHTTSFPAGGLWAAGHVCLLFPFLRQFGAHSGSGGAAHGAAGEQHGHDRRFGQSGDQQCARRRAALRIYGRLARAAGRHGCRRPGDTDRLSGQPDLAQIVSPLTWVPARELSGAVPGGERCGHFADGRGCLAVSVEGRDPL